MGATVWQLVSITQGHFPCGIPADLFISHLPPRFDQIMIPRCTGVLGHRGASGHF